MYVCVCVCVYNVKVAGSNKAVSREPLILRFVCVCVRARVCVLVCVCACVCVGGGLKQGCVEGALNSSRPLQICP